MCVYPDDDGCPDDDEYRQDLEEDIYDDPRWDDDGWGDRNDDIDADLEEDFNDW